MSVVPKPDDVFDILANIDSLNLYDEPGSIYRQGASDEVYKVLLSRASSMSGVSADIIEEAMNKIGWHESRNVVNKVQTIQEEYIDPQTGQKKTRLVDKGRGKGMYQYETSIPGKQGAGRTALNRLYNELGGVIASRDATGNVIPGVNAENILPFMDQYFPERYGSRRTTDSSGKTIDIDFSQLSKREQQVLFLADKLAQGVDFSDIGTDTAQWWLDHHKEVGGSTAAFDESMKSYKP